MNVQANFQSVSLGLFSAVFLFLCDMLASCEHEVGKNPIVDTEAEKRSQLCPPGQNRQRSIRIRFGPDVFS